MHHALLGVALAISALSCSRGALPAPAPERESREASLIRAARLEQNRAIRARDLDRVAEFWTPDIVVLAGLGARVQGITQLRTVLGADWRIVYERTPTDIQVSAGWDLAWETGTWAGSERAVAADSLITGRYASQWVRTAAGWKIRSELFVADRCFRDACQWPLAK